MKDLVFKTVMLKGEAGGTINRIEKTGSSGNVDTYTIYMNDGTTQTFEVTNGYSIISIEKTATVGNIDTYTVTIDNGDTYTFTVTNSNVADSMTAIDEATVAPSIHKVKEFVNNVTDADGLLFCGDFVNVPNSSIMNEPGTPRGAIWGLGWGIPDWLLIGTTQDFEFLGLLIDKTYTGTFDGFYSPKYHERHLTLADLGIDKAVVSVEWSKDGDSTIHTSTKVITDTTTNYAWKIMELEPNIWFKVTSFYGESTDINYGGTTRFGIETNGNTLQNDYYIRKIKIEKGEIPTPFGLNKDQFYALQIYYDFVRNLKNEINSQYIPLYGTITTDADGSAMTSVELPNGYTIYGLHLVSFEIEDTSSSDTEIFMMDFFGGDYAGNEDVKANIKLRRIWTGGTYKDYYVIYFNDPTAINKTLKYRILFKNGGTDPWEAS